MAEKMLTNWFAFLLHKFLKVRRDGAESRLPLCRLPRQPSPPPAIPRANLGSKLLSRAPSQKRWWRGGGGGDAYAGG